MPRNQRRSRWPSVVVILLLLVGGAAAAVHFKVMPLKVALSWFKPATLSVTSDPAGATLKLDGRELAQKTPLEVEVRRDRVEHTLELSRPGSKPVRATMRFDRTVSLSQSISLPEEPAPPPPPPIAEPEPAPPPPVAAQPVDPEVARKAARLEALAEEKAAKKAAKESKKKSKKAKAGGKAKAKGGSKAKAARAAGKPSAEPGGAEF